MIALIACGSYAAIWLLTARWLYGRWRGRQTGKRHCERHGAKEYRVSGGCCFDRPHVSDGEAAWNGMLAALAWPLVWLTALIRFKPPPTAAERAAKEAEYKARIAALDARNTELERELGMGGAP